jgi:NDP-sugar pyrophosphorylase family protein
VMQGLILAGGRGSRLAADGVEAPKALVEVAGRPQIVNLIDTFAELGCASVTCMVREGITVDVPKPTVVRTCRTPSSLHTLVAGLAIVPPGPVFCAMVDTVMPAADWHRVYRGVTERLANRAIAVLAVTPFVDDELPLYVTRNAEGLATAILDTPPPPPGQLLVTGGVYGLSPEARRLATVAVASLHRMRAFLRLLVELKTAVATVEVPRIIDLDHKSDLEAAERWLS